MILQHIQTIPDAEFNVSKWGLIITGEKICELVHSYPLVENGAIPFGTSLRRKAVSKARDLGYTVSSEDVIISTRTKVDQVEDANLIFGY